MLGLGEAGLQGTGMKAVNCVAKGVREALLRTSGAGLEVNVALALADK